MKIPIDESDESKFEMAPMIDMVFLLLVFFMCASHMSVIQNIEMKIPTAKKAVVPKERPERFIVNITKEGKLYSGNQPVETLKDLKVLVKTQKEITPEVKIYLRADQDTEYVHVKKVMGAMAEIGIDNFIFGAFIPDE